MSGRRITLSLAAACSILAAGACGTSDRGDAGSGGGEAVQVIAGFYPLAEAAQRVGGDLVEVTNLTPSGAEPHDLELGTRDVDRIEDADVVLYLGGGFQPAIAKAAERSDATAVDLLPPDEDDPHVWLDPIGMRAIVDRVEQALSEADERHADTYADNADAYRRDLEALDTDLRAGLTGCARTVIVTAHDAFGHLTSRYGLRQESIAGLEPESEPDPKRLAELATLVRELGVTTVFAEELVSPEVAEALAREAGVETAVLDPIEGIPADRVESGDDYLVVMRRNLTALRESLGCP